MRLRLGLAVLALGYILLAACTNSTGGTSTLPGGQLQPLQNPITPAASPTATPDFATGTIMVGDGSTLELRAPGDFKVSAVFPKSTASPIILNSTVSVAGPGGIPAYGPTHTKGFLWVKHHVQSPAVLYVWFSSDRNVTISALPTLDFTVPLTALEPFGTDAELRLALYDPANESKWTTGIARRMSVTPAPSPSGGTATATPTATATATATPTPSPTPTLTAVPTRSPGVGFGAPFGAPPPTLGPQVVPMATPRIPVQTLRMRFVPASRPMKLLAKKNLVFVLYAQSAPSPTPAPSTSASAASSPSASPSAAPSPGPSSS